MTTTEISIAEVKSRLSEYAARSAFAGERILITRRGKPLAALVSLEDLAELEQLDKKAGLASVIGKWDDFEEIEAAVAEAMDARYEGGEGRNVSL
jgi:prevent-host-death family protein